MANSELIEALQALAHERKIDEFYLIERLEASLAKSYQHILDLEWDARVTIDRQTGKIYVYELVPVGEPDPETGEYAEFTERDVTPDDVSRIAAQNAKSVISTIVREAGRQSIYQEFSRRVGDLVTGTVLQGTPDFTIIKIRDGVEAELPHYDLKRFPNERNERPNNEHYRHNQRLKVLIIDVRDPASDLPKARGDQARPSIIVSRTHPDLIRRLFEIEVPEIYDGVVEIKSIAREPGARSKVAVASREPQPRPGRSLRRPEGQPRAHGRRGAAQRARRCHPVERGPGGLCGQRAFPCEGDEASSSTRRTTTRLSSSPTISFPSPSARRVRTPASRRV